MQGDFFLPWGVYAMSNDLAFYDLSMEPGCTINHIRVYARLRGYAEWRRSHPDYGWAWPSIATLAAEVAISARTVIRCLHWLSARGHLRAEARYDEAGYRTSNRYWMLGREPPAPAASLSDKIGTKAPPRLSAKKRPPKCQKAPLLSATMVGTVPIPETDSRKNNPPLVPPSLFPAPIVAAEPRREDEAAASNGNGNGHGLVRTAARLGIAQAAVIVQDLRDFRQSGDFPRFLEDQLPRDQQVDVWVKVVFAYWATKLKHPHAFLDGRRRSYIRRRLLERPDGGDVNEVLFVVDGTSRDDHLMGRTNGGRRYDDIHTIYRDREQVERLAALGGYQPGMVHRVTQRYLNPQE